LAGNTSGIRRKFVWTSGILTLLLACGGTAFGADATATGPAAVDQAVAALSSPDASIRFQGASSLMTTPAARAAVPLAQAILDPADDVQMAAIAAELNIFLAEKLPPRKRIGLVIEPRSKGVGEAAFLRGPAALGAADVPLEVLSALRSATSDENPRVALEALYAFGILGADQMGAERAELLRAAVAPLMTGLGAPVPASRLAAARVASRLFQKRSTDEAVDERLGDALIGVLND
jgi:HEAT repeat protein